MIEAVFFDMDGVLTIQKSSWNYVHNRLGIDNSLNFRKYIEKKITYDEFFRLDIESWLSKYPDIKSITIKEILDEIDIMPGLGTLMEFLHENNIKSYIISGGISWLADKINSIYSFDGIFANEIYTDINDHIKNCGNIMVEPERKDIVIKNIINEYNIEKKNTLSIGDSDSDYSMYIASGKFISCNTESKKLNAISEAKIDNDLSTLLEYIKLY